MTGQSDAAERDNQTTTHLRWVWRDDTFASLMLGRIQLAQISKATASHHWFYTLFVVEPGERASYSAPDRETAMRAAQEHAGKVMSENGCIAMRRAP